MSSEEPERKFTSDMYETNTVYVGRKPAQNYVLAALTVLQTGAESVKLRARGMAINRAVDVAEIIVKRFGGERLFEYGKITTDTETFKDTDFGSKDVSSIEIELKKKSA